MSESTPLIIIHPSQIWEFFKTGTLTTPDDNKTKWGVSYCPGANKAVDRFCKVHTGWMWEIIKNAYNPATYMKLTIFRDLWTMITETWDYYCKGVSENCTYVSTLWNDKPFLYICMIILSLAKTFVLIPLLFIVLGCIIIPVKFLWYFLPALVYACICVPLATLLLILSEISVLIYCAIIILLTSFITLCVCFNRFPKKEYNGKYGLYIIVNTEATPINKDTESST
jgi:hypothetical protein